jgi:hypothetical protein
VPLVTSGNWTYDAGVGDLGDDISCTGSQVVRRNAGDTAFECATISGGGPTIAATTANRATTSNAFTDVTDLTFTIASGTNYMLDCFMSYTTAATGTALQLSLNGPASPTAVRFEVEASMER